MSRLTTPEILQKTYNKMHKATTKEEIYSIVREILEDGYNFNKQYFTHNDMNGKVWTGFIYGEHNALMGTIFSLFDNKPFIVRGYPKIKYTEDTELLYNRVIAEEKIDGTNLGIFVLPNGMPVVKTRNTEMAGVFNGINFTELLKETNLYDSLVSLASKCNLCIFGELYGSKNQGQFVKYDIPIAFKVFDIVDMRTYQFIPRYRIENYCRRYNIPVVRVEWRGVITETEYRKLTTLLDSRFDVEGFVAKRSTKKDRIFGKIKCERTKEKCISLCKPAIPKEIINKAIKKALDNGISYEDAFSFVRQELLEESDESLVNKSEQRIRNLISLVYNKVSLDDDNNELVSSALQMLEAGKSKSEILSELASKYKDNHVSPSRLYQAYCVALTRFNNSNSSNTKNNAKS